MIMGFLSKEKYGIGLELAFYNHEIICKETFFFSNK